MEKQVPGQRRNPECGPGGAAANAGAASRLARGHFRWAAVARAARGHRPLLITTLEALFLFGYRVCIPAGDVYFWRLVVEHRRRGLCTQLF